MPIYEYKCEACNITVSELRKVEERDELAEISIKHCPMFKESGYEQIKKVAEGKSTYIHGGMFITDIVGKASSMVGCSLKRVISSGSFTI